MFFPCFHCYSIQKYCNKLTRKLVLNSLAKPGYPQKLNRNCVLLERSEKESGECHKVSQSCATQVQSVPVVFPYTDLSLTLLRLNLQQSYVKNSRGIFSSFSLVPDVWRGQTQTSVRWKKEKKSKRQSDLDKAEDTGKVSVYWCDSWPTSACIRFLFWFSFSTQPTISELQQHNSNKNPTKQFCSHMCVRDCHRIKNIALYFVLPFYLLL